MSHLHLHIIANPCSGSGNGRESLIHVTHYLEQLKIPHTVYLSDYPGHSIPLAQNLLTTTLKPWSNNLQQPYPLLVVLGGDGTLHEVINALEDTPNIPLAYLPSGSGNDFARGANIPLNPVTSLEKILQTTCPKSIHLLNYFEEKTQETQYITNNLGIGLDGAIVASANTSKDKQWLNKVKLGSFVYLLSMVRTLFKQEGFSLTVTSEKESIRFENAFLVTCSNQPYFGGGVKILPQASLFDPTVELIVLEKISYFKILRLLVKLVKGTHLSDTHIAHFKAQTLHLSVDSFQYGQMDGEVIEKRPFDATITITNRLFWF